MSGLAVLLLAAGRSRRFGAADKLMAGLDGRPVVEWAIGAQAGLTARRFAVVGPDGGAAAARLAAAGFERVVNPDPTAGQGHSLALGAAAVARTTETERMLVLLGDMPRVTPALLARLLAAGDFAASSDGSRSGPPALFPRRLFGELARLRGEHGGRDWLAGAVPVIADPGELGDIDTVADLHALSTSSGMAT